MSVLAYLLPGHPQHHSAVVVWIMVVVAIVLVIGTIQLFGRRRR